jgi:thioredoxin-dependent peroxiredoxin
MAQPAFDARGGRQAPRTSGRVALPTMSSQVQLKAGDPAPEFTLPDAGGQPVSLKDFRGRRVIVYFYPAAMTAGCTKQACDFRDNLSELNGAGLTVLGISPDPVPKLARFRDEQDLTFPLLSDVDKTVLNAYGAYGEKKLYGKTVVGVIRSTFVVGADGKVEVAQYNVKATGHVAKLRRDLEI